MIPLAHMLDKSNSISYFFRECSMLYNVSISIAKGNEIKELPCKNANFKDKFEQILNREVCLFTNGSRVAEASYTGFSVISLDGSINKQFRAWSNLSSFSFEAMAILETVYICKSISANQFNIFSDSLSVLKNLNKSFDSGKDSIITLWIKDKIKKMEFQNK